MNFGEVLKTDDGSLTIRNEAIGEAYHSDMGAASEARTLYLNASGFSSKIELLEKGSTLQVLDVGLGLGYNAMSTIESWLELNPSLNLELTSLEINRDLAEAMRLRSAPWTEGWKDSWLSWSEKLNATSEQEYEAVIESPFGGKCIWRVLIGDAGHGDLIGQGTFTSKPQFDYVWQDAFSPVKNPEMWSEKWFTCLKGYCHTRTVLVSYSVARLVRDNLSASGWLPERIPTPSLKKRNWLKAKPLS